METSVKKTQLNKVVKKDRKTIAKKALVKKVKRSVVKKPVETKKVETKLISAHGRYVDMSAQKVRLVVNLIRGRNALNSVSILSETNKAAVRPVLKVLNSAIANAKNNFEIDEKNLVVTEAFVNDAPVYKRWKAGSRGRYQKILRRNCHITVILKGNK